MQNNASGFVNASEPVPTQGVDSDMWALTPLTFVFWTGGFIFILFFIRPKGNSITTNSQQKGSFQKLKVLESTFLIASSITTSVAIIGVILPPLLVESNRALFWQFLFIYAQCGYLPLRIGFMIWVQSFK